MAVDPAAPVIVVGVHGSPAGWEAFEWAAGEAERRGGRVVAVHATSIADPVAAFGLTLDYAGVAQGRQAIDGELRDEANRRAGRFGVPVDFVSENGDATVALARVADRLHADLVVVGRSTVARYRLAGAVGHRLTARTDTPVVTAP